MASTTTPGTSKELLAMVDVGWRKFREAVRHVGRAKMEEPTGAGWSFHDLVAHVAGWHDLTARRLRVFRTTGKFLAAGDEAALGIPAFKDTDELNTTYRALRSELAQLTDEQIHANDDWVIKLVAGNSYGHYDEHAGELGY